MTVSGPNYASGYANETATTWANESYAYGSTTGNYCTWTNASRRTDATIEFNGFGTWSDIPAGATIDSVVVSIKGYMSSATLFDQLDVQAFIGATGKGGGVTGLDYTVTSSTNVWPDITYTDITLAELQANTLSIHFAISRINSTTSSVFYLDYVKVTVNYSVNASVSASVVAGVASVPSPTLPNAQVIGRPTVAAVTAVLDTTSLVITAVSPITAAEDFEYASSGTITTGNSTFDGISGNPPTYATAPSGRTGNVGRLTNSAGVYAYWSTSAGFPATSGKHYLRGYIYFTDALLQYGRQFGFEDHQGSYAINGFTNWASGSVALRLASTNNGNSGASYTCSYNTWYRLEIDADFDAATLVGRIYLNDETTPVSTQTINSWGATTRLDWAVVQNAASTGLIYVDDMAYSNESQPGPSTGNPDATVTGLSAVAAIVTVPTATPQVVLPASTVAGTAAVPTATPRVAVPAAAVVAAAAVPSVALSIGLTATVVVAAATVPSPTARVTVPAVVVAAVAAVSPVTASVVATSSTVGAVTAVPDPAAILTEGKPTPGVVAAVAAVPAPLSLSAGLTVTTVVAAATTPSATAFTPDAAVSVTTVAAMASVGTVTGLPATTVTPTVVAASVGMGAGAGQFAVTGRYSYVNPSYSQTHTTSSFTPSANSLLFMLVTLEVQNSTATPDMDNIITDGGGLTWTKRADSGVLGSDPWKGQVALYTAPVGASPSAMTVTLDPIVGTQTWAFGVTIFDVTGYNVASPFAQAIAQNTTSTTGNSVSLTVTLAGAPSNGDLVLFMIGSQNDVSGAYAAMSGWSEVYNQTLGYCHEGVWYRTDTTSASATNTDLGTTIWYGEGFLVDMAPVAAGAVVSTGSTLPASVVAAVAAVPIPGVLTPAEPIAVVATSTVPSVLGVSAGLTATTVVAVAATPVAVPSAPDAQLSATVVAATCSVPTAGLTSNVEISDDLGLTDDGQTYDYEVFALWAATLSSTVEVDTGAVDVTVTGLDAVTAISAVLGPVPSVAASTATVAATATVPSASLSAGLVVATVVAVAAVPASGISTGLTASTVVSASTVPAPTPFVIVPAAVVAATAAVLAPAEITAPSNATVTGLSAVVAVAAVPAILRISVGLAASTVVGTGAVPAAVPRVAVPAAVVAGTASVPTAIPRVAVPASTIAAVAAVPTLLRIAAGLSAVVVAAVAAVPTLLRISAGLTASTVAATSTIPSPTPSAGTVPTPAVVLAVAAVPAPLGISAGLLVAVVAGSTGVPPPAALLAGATTAPAAVSAIALVPSPTPSVAAVPGAVGAATAIPAVALSAGLTVSTVAATGSVPAPAAIIAVTPDAQVTGLSPVAAAVAMPTLALSAGLAVTVVTSTSTVPAPVPSVRPTPTTVVATTAIPTATLRAVASPVAVVATSSVPAPLRLSAALSASVVTATASVPVPGLRVAVPASAVTAVAAVGQASALAGAGVTATTVVAASTVPAPTIGTYVGATAITIAVVATVETVSLSAGFTVGVVAAVAAVPSVVSLSIGVEGADDAGLSETTTTLDQEYGDTDSAALAEATGLDVTVADVEAGMVDDSSTSIDTVTFSSHSGSDSAVLGENVLVDAVLDDTDDLTTWVETGTSVDVMLVAEVTDHLGLWDNGFEFPTADDSATLTDIGSAPLIPVWATDWPAGTLTESTILQIGTTAGISGTEQASLSQVGEVTATPSSADATYQFFEWDYTLDRGSDVTDEASLDETFDLVVEVVTEESPTLTEDLVVEVVTESTDAASLGEDADAGPKAFKGGNDSATLAEEASIVVSTVATDTGDATDATALTLGYLGSDSATIIEQVARGVDFEVVEVAITADQVDTVLILSLEVEGSDGATLADSGSVLVTIPLSDTDSATLTEDSTDVDYEYLVVDLAALAESAAIEVLLSAVDTGVLSTTTHLLGPTTRPYTRNGRAVLIPSPGMAPVLSASGGRVVVTTVSGQARVVSGPGKVQVQSVPSSYARADEP